MNKSLKLFTTAYSISIIGTLPIGTLNTNVANYALKGDVAGAFKFGAAAILIEIILVRIAVVLIEKLGKLKKLGKVFSVIACIIIFVLAYKSLEAAFHMRSFQDDLPFVGMQPFYSGLVLSLVNPLHLPFWMGWTAVLKSRNVLGENPKAYNVYILGIGFGTSTAFVIYGLAGNFLMNTLKAEHNLINWILGATLLLTGLIQLYKLAFQKPKASVEIK